MQIARRALHALLPKGPKPRVLRFGLAKGATATIDFRYDTAFYFGLHEPWLHPFYRDILKPGMKCFDVGMYRGWDALCIAVLTRSEVVSFDSDPQFLEVTEQFLAPSDTNIRLECSYISDGQNGSATLDSFADKHFAPDFMKMDIEGGELAALRGASCILTVHKPSLVVETHSVELEQHCLALLRSYGYHTITINRPRSLFSEARGLSRDQNRWIVARCKC